MSSSETPSRPVPVMPPDGAADVDVAWHYGDPHAEQRALVDCRAMVDLSNRAVLTVSGPDRLSWLNDLVTHKVDELLPGQSALALILDPHGHVEHELHMVDDGDRMWITAEPGTGTALAEYLDKMRFMRRVEVADVSEHYAVVWTTKESATDQLGWQPPPEFAGTGNTESGEDRGGGAQRYVEQRPATFTGAELIIPRAELAAFLAGAGVLAGTWALEALRVAAGVPRLGFETDHKTLPHEVGWIGSGVHLAKGCYRGQETVARVHNLGRPPRRLVLLHLDGSVEELPEHGAQVLADDRVVGWIATPARHYELGPIATAVIKRNTPTTVPLRVRLPVEGQFVSANIEDIVVSG